MSFVDRLNEFRDHAPAAFAPPELLDLVARGRRHTTRRWLASGAALAAAAAVVAVVVVLSTTLRPVTSPEPPAPVANTITDVDWTGPS